MTANPHSPCAPHRSFRSLERLGDGLGRIRRPLQGVAGQSFEIERQSQADTASHRVRERSPTRPTSPPTATHGVAGRATIELRASPSRLRSGPYVCLAVRAPPGGPTDVPPAAGSRGRPLHHPAEAPQMSSAPASASSRPTPRRRRLVRGRLAPRRHRIRAPRSPPSIPSLAPFGRHRRQVRAAALSRSSFRFPTWGSGRTRGIRASRDTAGSSRAWPRGAVGHDGTRVR